MFIGIPGIDCFHLIDCILCLSDIGFEPILFAIRSLFIDEVINPVTFQPVNVAYCLTFKHI